MKRGIRWKALAALALTLALLGTGRDSFAAAARQSSPLVFAAIGDYGLAGPAEEAVANLVKSWNPAFIVTLGDNNYPNGASYSLEDNIGRYFSDYIFRYRGKYGNGSPTRRFFPALGNHDWHQGSVNPYLNYFDLPGNERYYDFVQGPVHFFILDSVEQEPDGVSSTSGQAAWLRQALAASASKFNVVVAHYPPYSSGKHGSVPFMQWPFKEWGADVVLAGHNHVYERLAVDGLTYIVNGLGGDELGGFRSEIHPQSLVRYNASHGALRAEATDDSLKFQFITVNNQLIDEYILGGAPQAVSISREESHPGGGLMEFRVRFSEAVTGVDVSDFALAANGLNGAYVVEVNGAGSEYLARVNVGQGAGSLRLDLIDNDSVVNQYGAPLGGTGWGNGGLSSETYAVDALPPLVSSIARIGVSPTRADVVDFNVKFSEPVFGVDSSDFAISAAGINGAAVANVVGGGDSYIVSVNTGAGDGELRLDLFNNFSVADAAGNPLANALAGESYLVQKSAPVVLSIARLSAEQTNAGEALFSVVFSEPVAGVDAFDFALNAEGISGAYISAVGGEGATYLVTVQTGAGDGALRLDLLDDDSVTNLAGVPLGGSGANNGDFTTGESYLMDKTAPVVLNIARASPNPTNAASVQFLVTFSEPITGLSAADFILNSGDGATLGEISGADSSYLVSVTTGPRADSLRLDLVASGKTLDRAGNPVGAGFFSGESYAVNKIPPTVLSIARRNENPASAPRAEFEVKFSEAVTGVDLSDFQLKTEGARGAFLESVVGAGDSYVVSVFTGMEDGSLRLDLADDNSVTNALGSPLGGFAPGDGNFVGETYQISKAVSASKQLPAPDALSPTRGATLNALRVQLAWTKVAGAAYYEAVVARDAAFQQIVSSAFVNETQLEAALPGDGIYYWQVRALDANRGAGKFSAAVSFVVDVTPPPAPSLLAPQDGAQLSARWKFSWSDVGATRYEIQIDDNADFSSPAWTSWRRAPSYSIAAMRKGIYFWRVRAKDGAGNWSAWSAVFTLTVP